jgi:hypothetical protein
MTTKYYAGTINEFNGDREYDTTYYFTLPSGDESASEAMECIANEWYGRGSKWDEDMQAWNFGDSWWVSAGNVIEIPEEVYNLMRTL